MQARREGGSSEAVVAVGRAARKWYVGGLVASTGGKGSVCVCVSERDRERRGRGLRVDLCAVDDAYLGDGSLASSQSQFDSASRSGLA